jgi:hypothetical protein
MRWGKDEGNSLAALLLFIILVVVGGIGGGYGWGRVHRNVQLLQGGPASRNYLAQINNQATFQTLNYLWTIPFQQVTAAKVGFRETNQSYLNNNSLRLSPQDSSNLNDIIKSFPKVGDILTPSWFCSQVAVAVNRYDPTTFNQIYQDSRKNVVGERWQVQNNGGRDAHQAYWFYLCIGSGIWTDLTHCPPPHGKYGRGAEGMLPRVQGPAAAGQPAAAVVLNQLRYRLGNAAHAALCAPFF